MNLIEEYKVWKDKSDNSSYMKKLVKKGEDLTVVGIVQPVEGATAPCSLLESVILRSLPDM